LTGKERTMSEATATLEWLPLARLDPHPENPRLALRDEVIAALAAQIAAHGFRPEYALLVRPVGDRYQVIAGHHRREAAQRAGLTEVPAWVRPMDDAQAYMDLCLGNTQGELSPLEIGLHAYGAVERGKGGADLQGGLSGYARRIGRTKGYLSQLVAAAQVYAALPPGFTHVNRAALAQKTKHLYEVSRVPQSQWPDLVALLLAEDWTVETTRAAVEERMAVALTAEELLDLKRAVRRRGGVYAGERRVNGVTTRHLVTLPGQPERAYTTPALREALLAWAERDEALPADLAAAWDLSEQAALLVARHRATSVATEPGLLIQITAEARDYQPDLDRLHADGWTFHRDEAAWEARHPTYGAARAERVPLLVRQADRVVDATREQQARALIAQADWDAAEQIILSIQHAGTKNALMADFSRAARAATLTAPPAPPVPDHHAAVRAARRSCGRPASAGDLPTPPAGWDIWRDDDQQIGMQHDCGIKLRGPDAAALVSEAQTLTRWIAALAGWWVCQTPTGWQASHASEGMVTAPALDHLALAAWRAGCAAQDLPDLPDPVIDAAFLAGWAYLTEEPGDRPRYRYRLPNGAEGWFSLGELCYELGLPEARAFSVGEPDAVPAPCARMYHLPADFAAVQAQAAPVATLAMQMQDGAFRLTPTGQPAEVFGHPQWEQVKVRVALLVAQADRDQADRDQALRAAMHAWIVDHLRRHRTSGGGEAWTRLLALALGYPGAVWDDTLADLRAAIADEICTAAWRTDAARMRHMFQDEIT
jgi:ParB/RepB/Spo0J family partition protein